MIVIVIGMGRMEIEIVMRGVMITLIPEEGERERGKGDDRSGDWVEEVRGGLDPGVDNEKPA